MAKAVVVADDLTGALDTGVRFAGNGSVVRVLVREADCAAALGESALDALVVSTRSRHAPADVAAARVRAVLLQVASAAVAGKDGSSGRPPLLYKKCDSTLRGNIGAELEAFASASPASALLFAPAFPELGRTTRGGIHYVNGVPVVESSFGTDALNPVRSSSIAGIVAEQSALPVRTCTLADCVEGIAGGSLPAGVLCVPDVESEDDLAALAAALSRAAAAAGKGGALPLLAGSAGLAAYLSGLCGIRARPRTSTAAVSGAAAPVVKGAAPFLAVVGSRHPLSREQAARAAARGFLEVDVPAAAAGAAACALATATQAATAPAATAAATVPSAAPLLSALRAGRDCLLISRAPGSPGAVSRALADLCFEAVASVDDLVLIVFGGDTLEAILDRLSVGAVEPLRELMPGIVLARVRMEGRSLRLVTKAGGFGDADLLVALKAMEDSLV